MTADAKEKLVKYSADIDDVLSRVSFAPSCLDLHWKWESRVLHGGKVQGGNGRVVLGWLIRASFTRPDTHTGIPGRGYGRWEFVAFGASESAAVKTCWLLAELVVRHELMESFLYRGVRIFDPHRTVTKLAGIGSEVRGG